MHRLTREVRFSINRQPDEQLAGSPSNSFGGFPTLRGAGRYFALQVTLQGELEPDTGYLLNIKQIDDAIRTQAIPFIAQRIERPDFSATGTLANLFSALANAWTPASLSAMSLVLTPTLKLEIHHLEPAMVRLSQKFEFSASHRLHNPSWSDERNRSAFGKCNNPHGHGHNYEVQVTMAGRADDNGLLMNVPELERIVLRTIIEPFDHKNLNLEVPEFRALNPSVENIAMVIYQKLKPELTAATAGTRLDSVTVWETPKTWSEYRE